MKINKSLLKFCFALVAMVSIFSCTDSDEIDNRMHGYGDMQLKLYKEVSEPAGATRAEDGVIDYLANVAKVKLSFIYENSNLELVLPMNASEGETAEFGIGSTPVKMLAGSYKIVGYILYDKLDQEIGYGEPTAEEELVVVDEAHLSIHEICVNVTERGKIKFNLTKDFSDFTRAIDTDDRPREYTFDDIKEFDITLMDANDPLKRIYFSEIEGEIDLEYAEDGYKSVRIVSDSILFVEAGSYKIYSLVVKNSAGDLLEYSKLKFDDVIFNVEDNALLTADVPVKIYSTDLYIYDYYAIKEIWEALDGPNWSFKGEGVPDGTNWNFNKDIDMWGLQPGVMVHPNGRVATLNIGSFNPNPNNDGHGDVPAALGVLTELVELHLGTHNDRIDEIGTNTYASNHDLNPYLRSLSGNPINASDETRMEYAKNLLKALHPISPDNISDIIMDVSTRKGKPYYVAPAPYAVVPHGRLTNHITSLPEELGNLTKLHTLFIANNLVSDLPDSFVKLTKLTDVEIYNCPKMTKIPDVVAELSSIILLNISANEHMAATMPAFLDKLFTGPSQREIQILYCTDNMLAELPTSVKNLKKLGLLDLSTNKLTTIPPLGIDVSPVQLAFDSNQLTELQVDENGFFCNVADIETIMCSNNKFEYFPNIFTSESNLSVQSIDFSGNKLKGVDETDAFKGVYCDVLNLSYNEFTDIPIAFAESKSKIAFLDMKMNKLDSIRGASLMGMITTTALDFSGNNLSNSPYGEEVPFSFARELPFLNGVDLSRNSYEKIPDAFFNGYGINSFFISDQADEDGNKTLTEWPEGIEVYLGLRVLLVDGNDIRTIRKMPTLLNAFSVKGNPNLAMEVPFEVCRRLSEALMMFEFDLTQTGITGCPILGIGEGEDL